MKYSRLMRERIRRTGILFRELGYQLQEAEMLEDTYSAGFESDDGFQGGLFIDRDSKFLELAFTFSFPPGFGEYIRRRIGDIFHVSYEYGCYLTIESGEEELALTMFSKVYYAGLNYFALKETVRDFRDGVAALEELFELAPEGADDARYP